nr:transcription replication factor M2-2 [Human metapneumovirus]WHE09217.1 transcription replication factor M2-2 [Human metapneumovirus]WHE09631.1 transcription replication factor M2-2 [Human metapneumovirus]
MTLHMPCKTVKALIKCSKHGPKFITIEADDIIWTHKELKETLSDGIVKSHTNIYSCYLENIEIIYVKTYLS